MSNLRIWDEVKTTNPAFLKEYKGAGGFSGTAINGHHLIGRATEIFGPCGHRSRSVRPRRPAGDP